MSRPHLIELITTTEIEPVLVVLALPEHIALVNQHNHAVKHYLATGDAEPLHRLAGASITISGQRHELLTDTTELERRWNLGVLSLEAGEE
jgi:hypothetical protein